MAKTYACHLVSLFCFCLFALSSEAKGKENINREDMTLNQIKASFQANQKYLFNENYPNVTKEKVTYAKNCW